MRSEIITLTKNGNVSGLQKLLLGNCQDRKLMEQLSLDYDLIKEILFTTLIPFLESFNDEKEAQPTSLNLIIYKNQIKKIEHAVQILIAFGIPKPKDISLDDLEQSYNVSSQTTCDVTNFNNHTLNESTCVSQFLLSLNNSKEFDAYLSYTKKQTNLLALVASDQIQPIIESHRAAITAIENHISHRTFVSFTEQQLKIIVCEKGGDKTQIRLGCYLSEWSCRRQGRDLRQGLEDKLVAETMSRYPSKQEQINYLSLEAGELLQDFIVVFKLLKAGYKHISIALVEPRLQVVNYVAFQNLYHIAKELGAELNIKHYLSIEHYKSVKGNKLHVVNVMDFKDIFKNNVFNNVIETHKLLEDRGVFLFSYTKYKFILDKQGLYPIDLPDEAQVLLEKMNGSIPEKFFNCNIANISTKFNMELWVWLLPKLCATTLCNINLHMLAPRKCNYFGAATDEKNHGFNKDNLEYFLNLCLQGKKKVTVSLFDTEDEILKAQPMQGYDIVLQIGIASGNLDDLYQTAGEIRERAPMAAYYCFSQYTKEKVTVPFIDGLVRKLPEKSEVITQFNSIKLVLQHLSTIGQKIQEHVDMLSKRTSLPFFWHSKEKAKRMEEAAQRANSNLQQYLLKPNLNLAEAIAFVFKTKFEGKESLMEAYSYNSSILGYSDNSQKEIIAFIQTKFNMDISRDAVEEELKKQDSPTHLKP